MEDLLIKQLYKQAKLLGACDLFTGKETTLEELINLYLSPQGQEFCKKMHFPNITTYRQIKELLGSELKDYGIYIDEGNIRIKNPASTDIVLIGRTTATILCNECKLYRVTALQGAKAIVNATDWAVVATDADEKENIICNISCNAIIL